MPRRAPALACPPPLTEPNSRACPHRDASRPRAPRDIAGGPIARLRGAIALAIRGAGSAGGSSLPGGEVLELPDLLGPEDQGQDY
jgi:hypothetical protein